MFVSFMRTWTYAAILLIHAISAFSFWANYLDPWTDPKLLFLAAIAMLAACGVLWLMREFDTYTINGCRKPNIATTIEGTN